MLKNLYDGMLRGDDPLAQIPSSLRDKVISNNGLFAVLPGFCDVHVHFREPGFCYKETIRTGSMAAAAGGYTAVCAMPNLNPVPDSPEHLLVESDAIRHHSLIDVYPYGALTVGQQGETLTDLDELSPDVIAFSDDGKGVQEEAMMRCAMKTAARRNKIIAAHCEVNELLNGGYIHDGIYAKTHSHKGICSESERRMIERDLRLAKETRCRYHVCHISCKESVELIRRAKAEGTDVTCETCPHYLVLDENDLQEDGRFKMNPPLRSRSDREALLEGLLDGTIDMIATDHAPHSAEEKAKGLSGSAFGIVGLETAFPVLYTSLVRKGIITVEMLVRLLCHAPRKRFGIPCHDDWSIWDLSKEYTIEPERFLSMGKATPFAGWKVNGKCLMTVHNGKTVYINTEEK